MMPRVERDVPVDPVGVIHGRFQPLHFGHLEYLLAAHSLCQTLVVGITSPDPWLLGDESTNPERGEPGANPFTFYERYLMVSQSLLEAGLQHDELRIVPFPHSYPERLHYYAPKDALYFLSIYDDWGETKLRRFVRLGLRTHVLWRRSWRLTSGKEIRALIRSGDQSWRKLVPAATVSVIDACDLHDNLLVPAPRDDTIAGVK